jgi:hypothetical protein
VMLGMESITLEDGEGLSAFYRTEGGEPRGRGGREMAASGV